MDVVPIGDKSTEDGNIEMVSFSAPAATTWPQTPGDWASLMDEYLSRLVRYAFRRLRNLQDAEDVVQDVFVRAYAARTARQPVGRPGAYLYRMVANACTDFLRKHHPVIVSLDEIAVEELGSGGKNPHELAAAAEEMRRAEEMLRHLPQEQAEVVRLRVFGELRLHEIAEIVRCSPDTASSRLRYGFAKLRKIVSRKRGDGDELPSSATVSR